MSFQQRQVVLEASLCQSPRLIDIDKSCDIHGHQLQTPGTGLQSSSAQPQSAFSGGGAAVEAVADSFG